MSNFDEIKSLNLFGGNEGENKNEEAIGGEMIGTVDAKGKPLDSILEARERNAVGRPFGPLKGLRP